MFRLLCSFSRLLKLHRQVSSMSSLYLYVSTPQLLGQPMTISVPLRFEHLLDTKWKRRHLNMVGSESLKLALYRRLCVIFPGNGGSILKVLVHDILAHIRHNVALDPDGVSAQELKLMMFFETNQTIVHHTAHCVHKCNWIFTAVGLMLMTSRRSNMDTLVDRIIEIYFEKYNVPYVNEGSNLAILDCVRPYYRKSRVDKNLLYRKTPPKLTFTLNGSAYPIQLPPLPEIKDKTLLSKALIHKELVRGFLSPDHTVGDTLQARGIPLTKSTRNVLRQDLSFLDGMGDFYLGHEATDLIFKLKPSDEEVTFTSNTYTFVRTVLVTNTLFAKLAVAYGLPFAFQDPVIQNLLFSSYLVEFNALKPKRGRFTFYNTYNSQIKYEQELLGDYFEQYAGALFMELPELAHRWIDQIYSCILKLVPFGNFSNKKTYDYRNWCTDMLGRALF